ncbi:MAG: tyrosine-type recombinase/integrase [Henriciella sp.]
MGDNSPNSAPASTKGKPLTAAFVKTVKKPGKYHDGQNTGLILQVARGGRRYWMQRIVIKGKRTELGIGNAQFVSLSEARDRAFENKRAVLAGEDPLATRKLRQREITFKEAVELFLPKQLQELSNEKHRKQWRSTLETYALPSLGHLRVADIETRHVLGALTPIWADKTETAKRLRSRIEAVLSWATVAGHRTGDNPARWKGNLSELLASPSRIMDASNQPALQAKDLSRWWQALKEKDGMAARAVEFVCLTAARSGEVRKMVWEEFDPDKRIWTVPARRTKTRREHRIPLPEEAVSLLSRLPRLEGSDFVFFAPRGGALSDMSLSAVMRRLHECDVRSGGPGFVDRRNGRPAVPHGLRSTFRDWAAEQGIDRNLAEICLAHKVGTEVERAYLRTDMLEQRRQVMEDWSRLLAAS